MTGYLSYIFHTLAEDPASARDPFKPFFLSNPEPDKTNISTNFFIKSFQS